MIYRQISCQSWRLRLFYNPTSGFRVRLGFSASLVEICSIKMISIQIYKLQLELKIVKS